MKLKLAFLTLLAVLFLSSCGDKTKPVVVEGVKINVDSLAPAPKMMIIATISIKPESADAFIEAAKDIIAKSNAEEGCNFYQLYRDPYDGSKFIFVEEYENQAAVDFHFAAEYFNSFGPKIADMVASPAVIKVIEVASETVK